jgi:hypothetical protein
MVGAQNSPNHIYQTAPVTNRLVCKCILEFKLPAEFKPEKRNPRKNIAALCVVLTSQLNIIQIDEVILIAYQIF